MHTRPQTCLKTTTRAYFLFIDTQSYVEGRLPNLKNDLIAFEHQLRNALQCKSLLPKGVDSSAIWFFHHLANQNQWWIQGNQKYKPYPRNGIKVENNSSKMVKYWERHMKYFIFWQTIIIQNEDISLKNSN